MTKLAGFVGAAALVFTVACGQTDAGITTAVKSKLAADDMVKAYQVDVETDNNVVTLRGDVETVAQKERAVLIARDTDGVADVIDQLRVNPTAATTGVGDADRRGDVDVDVNDDFGDNVERGAEELKDGARKAGEAVGDAVDGDPDSNRDGR